MKIEFTPDEIHGFQLMFCVVVLLLALTAGCRYMELNRILEPTTQLTP